MATYCTVADVQRLNSQRDYGSPGSKLGRDDIFEIIEDIGDEIDGGLRRAGFTLPVLEASSPIAYALLGVLNALGAAARAEDSIFMQSSPNQSTHGQVLNKSYEGMSEGVYLGRILLYDATAGPILPKNVMKIADFTPTFALDDEW